MLQQGAHQPRYGIGVTHHWICPLLSLHLEQDQIAADGVDPSTGFRLQLSSLDTSVALEGQNKDVRQVLLPLIISCSDPHVLALVIDWALAGPSRFSVASISLDDLAEKACRARIFHPAPQCIKGFGKKALVQRMFQASTK